MKLFGYKFNIGDKVQIINPKTGQVISKGICVIKEQRNISQIRSYLVAHGPTIHDQTWTNENVIKLA